VYVEAPYTFFYFFIKFITYKKKIKRVEKKFINSNMSVQNVGLWFIMVQSVLWIFLVAKWNPIVYMIFNLL
jgi:hypothetical protein